MTCMKYKTIKNFLLNYNESRWNKLIPSLLEIAILNLHISFETNFFSEKDLENIINDLKSNFKKKVRNNEINNNQNLDEIIIEKSNKENIRKKKIKKSKSKERKINEEYKDYEEENENESIKRKKKTNINKSNYDISYDKNLRPEIIEKTELKSKKEGKIIKRMTEEEYNAQYDSQGEERVIQNNNKRNVKNTNNKNNNNNYDNYNQMPDQDGQNQNQQFVEYNNNMEQYYEDEDENEQEFKIMKKMIITMSKKDFMINKGIIINMRKKIIMKIM